MTDLLHTVATGPGRGLRYLDTGPARTPAVVLLHSLGADHRMWRPQLATLAGRFRVLAPDSRGHGGSGGLGIPDMATWSADVGHVLDAAGLDRVAMVGVSLGGMQAVAFAADQPDRVEALVVAGSFVELPPEVAAARIEALAGRARRLGMAALADEYVRETFVVAPVPDGAADVRAAIAAMAVEDYTAAVTACFRVRLADRLAAVTAPTLVVWGGHDAKAPRPLSERIAAGIPRARLVELPAAGHLANLDDPAGFDAAVAGHLAAVRA